MGINSHHQLLSVLSSMTSSTILVIGDVMLDEYHWCSVERISPEAPVPVCRVLDTTLVPGGAANVARNITALDSTTILLGVYGNDSSGDRLIDCLEAESISTSSLIRHNERPTILKSRIIAHQQHVARVDREVTTPLDATSAEELMSRFQDVLPLADVVLISDYAKGTLRPEHIQMMISAASSCNKPVVVDPKGRDYSRYRGATVLTPNFSEFLAAISDHVTTEESIHHAGNDLISAFSIDSLLVTRSEKGMSVIKKNGKKIDIPTNAKQVYDITGAGDSVISMLSIALASGCTIEDAAALANIAAGIVVGKVGTSIVSLSEIRDTLETYKESS